MSIETLKFCLDKETRAEKAFIRYCIVTIFIITIIEIAEAQPHIMIPVLGEVSSSIIQQKKIFILGFLAILLLYSIAEWALAVVDMNRHPLYGEYSKRESFAAIFADWWDKRVDFRFLKVIAILDLLQNFILLLMFVFLYLWK